MSKQTQSAELSVSLPAVEEEYRRLMATQPWLKRELTTAEFAEEMGWSRDTVLRMIQDGIIHASRRDWRYRVPRSELERWRSFTDASAIAATNT